MLRILIVASCLALALGAKSSSTPLLSPSPVATSAVASSANVTSSSIANTSFSTSVNVSTSVQPNGTVTPSQSMSSTVMPSSSATPKPTPTPKPAPKPAPKHGDYSAKNKDGFYCLLALLDVAFTISYNKTVKKGNTTDSIMQPVTVRVPIDQNMTTTAKSTCGTRKSTLVIEWPKTAPKYSLTFDFKNKSSKSWEVNGLELVVTTEGNAEFMNATAPKLMVQTTNSTELKRLYGQNNGYYLCAANRTYPLGNTATLYLEYVKLQPFDVPKNNTEIFSSDENNCEATKPTPAPTNNVVPIAVGCALAGLVLIVLIAYIIGRRKSQKGYEKV